MSQRDLDANQTNEWLTAHIQHKRKTEIYDIRKENYRNQECQYITVLVTKVRI